MLYEKTNELYHHGVKGQKWGVRKQVDTIKLKEVHRQKQDKTKDAIKTINRAPGNVVRTTFHAIGGFTIGQLLGGGIAGPAGGLAGGIVGAGMGAVKGILKSKLHAEKQKENKEIKNVKITYKNKEKIDKIKSGK